MYSLKKHKTISLNHLGIVLVLAGIELIFFMVASMGLCFGFVLKTVLIIQGYFSYSEQCLHRVKVFSASHPTPPARRLGGTRSWEGTQLGQLTPTDQRDISDHMVLCSAIKAGGR